MVTSVDEIAKKAGNIIMKNDVWSADWGKRK